MKKVLVFAVLSALCLASCSKENSLSSGDITKSIAGKWKSVAIDGAAVPTNDRIVMTYHLDGTGLLSNYSDEWTFSNDLNFTVVGDEIVFEAPAIMAYAKLRVQSISNKSLVSNNFEDRTRPELNGKKAFEFELVSKDLKSEIIGIWEGVSLDGQSLSGDEKHRWEYKEDGTYEYYCMNDLGMWQPSSDLSDEYYVDGDWLSTKWVEDGVVNVENWDISIESDVMTWTALRKNPDGTTYNTKFVMRRVDNMDGTTLCDKYIASKVLGNWRTVSYDSKAMTTDSVKVGYFATSEKYYSTWSFKPYWLYRQEWKYSIKKDLIYYSCVSNSDLYIDYVDYVSDEKMVTSNAVWTSKPEEKRGRYEYVKMTNDFSQAIIGTWEGVSREGDPTYADEHHRWRFFNDGTYYFLVQSGDHWVLSENTLNEYMVDGDFMSSRWQDELGNEFREWWIIESCTDSQMVWTALREKTDGTRYQSKFTLERVFK